MKNAAHNKPQQTGVTRRLILAVAAFFAALSATAAYAQGLTDTQRLAVDQAVSTALARTATPGASIAVIKDGQIAYLQAYGDAQVSPQVVAQPSMRFAIGSVSKQFTAVAALMLAEEGKLSLDEPISRWYPDLTSANRITLRHLLSHTSGYADFWPQDYVMPAMTRNVDPEAIIREWARKPLEFQPGDRYEYSNTGFTIAGRIVEKVSGKPLFDFLKERVFDPLGMTSAHSFDRLNLSYPPDAMGYRRGALAPVRRALPEGSGWGLGAFELAMTAEDLGKWCLALIDRRLLTPASYEQLFNSTKLSGGRDAGYSLGLSANTTGRRRVGHGGEVAGFMAQQTVWFNDRAAVVAFSNLEAAPAASQIASAVGLVLFPSGSPPSGTQLVPPALPLPPETPEGTKVRTLIASLAKGAPDRTLMTETLSAYFDRDIAGDFASSLSPLGEVRSVQGFGQFRRGGMTGGNWRVVFTGGAIVSVSTYVTADGKFEQFLVSP